MYFKFAVIAFSIVGLTGCALMGAPGSVAKNKSDYDGTVEVALRPGWANNDMLGSLKVGARKSSKMGKDEAFLVVRNDMIKNFNSDGPNFYVKIDGVETKLSPVSKETRCEISSSTDPAHCSQDYLVKMSFIEQMVKAADVKFRLNLRDSYVEGSLWRDGMSTARAGLKDFLETVKTDPAFGGVEVRKPATN